MGQIFSLQNFTIYFVPSLLIALLFSRSVADVMTIIAGVVFLLHSFRENDWGWLKDPVIFCALALVLYCIFIVSPFADKPLDTAVRSISWFRFLLFYGFLVYVLPKYSKNLTGPFFIILIIFLIVSLDSFYQYITGVSISGNAYSTDRLTSFLDRPNIGTFLFKSMFAFASFFIAVQFFNKKMSKGGLHNRNLNKYLHLFFYIVWILATTVILLSGERSTTIMMVGSFFILIPGLLLFDKAMRKWAPIILILTGAIVTVAVSTQPNLLGRLEKTQKQLSDFRHSHYGYLTVAGWEIAKANPLTGIGHKAYEDNCREKIIPLSKKHLCRPHSHNPYMEWLVIAGFPGLLIYCALVFSILYNLLQGAWHQSRLIVTAIALSALSISLFPFLFSQSLISNWPGILAWLSIGLATASVKIAKEIKRS